MSSLYKKSGSPFWWLYWRNPDTGKTANFSTKLRHDNVSETRSAKLMENEHSGKELVAKKEDRFDFAVWVVPWLKQIHGQSPKTLQRELQIWKIMAHYLGDLKIAHPSQLRRVHFYDYFTWRADPKKGSQRKKPVCHNTMMREIKILIKLVNESLRREIISKNPCYKLGLHHNAVSGKDEMSDQQIETILGRIENLAAKARCPSIVLTLDGKKQDKRYDTLPADVCEALRVSFEIARFQGVRLSETYLPMAAFNLRAMEFNYVGKGRRPATAPLNPALVPLIKQLRENGQSHTYTRPPQFNQIWFRFFDALRKERPDFKNISFHSTRVTVISRIGRAGASEATSMKIVNHASTTVHRMYRKVKPSEVRPFWDAVSPSFPSAPSHVLLDTQSRFETPDFEQANRAQLSGSSASHA